MIDAREAQLSAGVAVLAAVIEADGEGPAHPTIVFRFTKPNGEFYPPIMLVDVEGDQLAKLPPLVARAVEGAIAGAARI